MDEVVVVSSVGWMIKDSGHAKKKELGQIGIQHVDDDQNGGDEMKRMRT